LPPRTSLRQRASLKLAWMDAKSNLGQDRTRHTRLFRHIWVSCLARAVLPSPACNTRTEAIATDQAGLSSRERSPRSRLTVQPKSGPLNLSPGPRYTSTFTWSANRCSPRKASTGPPESSESRMATVRAVTAISIEIRLLVPL
jgi:hypothetical protein